MSPVAEAGTFRLGTRTPSFPLGGFGPLQSEALSGVAARLGHTPLQEASAWLLRRSPNVLPIPGTSAMAHLAENLAADSLALPEDALHELDAVGSTPKDGAEA